MTDRRDRGRWDEAPCLRWAGTPAASRRQRIRAMWRWPFQRPARECRSRG